MTKISQRWKRIKQKNKTMTGHHRNNNNNNNKNINDKKLIAVMCCDEPEQRAKFHQNLLQLCKRIKMDQSIVTSHYELHLQTDVALGSNAS